MAAPGVLLREVCTYYRPTVAGPDGLSVRIPRGPLTGPAAVAKIGADLIGSEVVEVFGVVICDGRNVPIGWSEVSRGTVNATMVDPAAVVRPAVLIGACAIACVHNHPSGDPAPSPEDVAVTRRVREAAELFGLSLLDHVVVGAEGRFYSFRDSGACGAWS